MASDHRWGLSRATLAVGIPMQPPAYFLSHVVAKPAGLVQTYPWEPMVEGRLETGFPI